jgi:hypothetical protein
LNIRLLSHLVQKRLDQAPPPILCVIDPPIGSGSPEGKKPIRTQRVAAKPPNRFRSIRLHAECWTWPHSELLTHRSAGRSHRATQVWEKE